MSLYPSQLGVFTPPIVPDFAYCDGFSFNLILPDLQHCRTAWTNLPLNHDPVRYRGLKRPAEPGGLLVVEEYDR